MKRLKRQPVILTAFASLLLILPVKGDINLELVPTLESAAPGEMIGFELYAVSESGTFESFPALEMVFEWSYETLQLQSVEPSSFSWTYIGLPADDPYGLNESIPPADGNGLFHAGSIGSAPQATSEGFLISTFYFEVINADGPAFMEPLASGGYPETDTIVYSSLIPNLSILGETQGASIAITPEPASLFLIATGSIVLCIRKRHPSKM